MTKESAILEIMKPASIISEDASLYDAVVRMNKEKTNTLLVVDMDGKLTGEVSVTDLLGAVVPDDLDGDSVIEHFADEAQLQDAVKNASDKAVSECMTTDIVSVHANAKLIEVAGTAIAMGQARIPVVDEDDHPIGIISRQGLKHILSKYLEISE